MAANDSTNVIPDDELSDADISEIAQRIEQAAYSMLAVHNLAIDARDSHNAEWLLVAIQELARSTFKGLDACRERLTGGNRIGNFEGEFHG